jgi:hypothetical protein
MGTLEVAFLPEVSECSGNVPFNCHPYSSVGADVLFHL